MVTLSVKGAGAAVQTAKAILPLSLLHVSFLRQKIWDVFYDPPDIMARFVVVVVVVCAHAQVLTTVLMAACDILYRLSVFCICTI